MSEFAGRATVDLAMQLLREGNIGECISCAEKIMSSDPDNAKALSILGAAYAQSGDKGMAIASFEKSLALEPNARGHFNLGMAYEKCDRQREAFEQYQFAVRCDPSYRAAAESMNRLSKMLQGSSAPSDSGSAGTASVHLLSGEAETAPPVIEPVPQKPAQPIYGSVIVPPKIDPNSIVDHGPQRIGNFHVKDEVRPAPVQPPVQASPPPPPAPAPSQAPKTEEFQKVAPAAPLYGPTIAPPKIDPNSIVEHGPRKIGNYSVQDSAKPAEEPTAPGAALPEADDSQAEASQTQEFKMTPPTASNFGPVITQSKIDPNKIVDHDEKYNAPPDDAPAVAPPAADPMVQAQYQPTLTQQAAHIPQQLAQDPYAPPVAPNGYSQTIVGGPPPVQQAAIPPLPSTYAPHGKLPNLQDLEWRAKENDAKARAAQKKMTISGLIYGILCGGVVGLLLGMLPFMVIIGATTFLIINGIIVGAIVGFWIGFTCGDDITGLKVGAIIGAVGFILPRITQFGKMPMSDFGLLLFLFVFIYGILGYFIGKLVESSIGGDM